MVNVWRVLIKVWFNLIESRRIENDDQLFDYQWSVMILLTEHL